jgi:hypothetical protein
MHGVEIKYSRLPYRSRQYVPPKCWSARTSPYTHRLTLTLLTSTQYETGHLQQLIKDTIKKGGKPQTERTSLKKTADMAGNFYTSILFEKLPEHILFN